MSGRRAGSARANFSLSMRSSGRKLGQHAVRVTTLRLSDVNNRCALWDGVEGKWARYGG